MQKDIYPPVEWVTIAPSIKTGNKTLRLISRDYFLTVYVGMELTREQFKELCGINESKFVYCYHYWFTERERKVIGGKKIAKAQRLKNSNLVNAGIPRVLLPKDELEQFLECGFSLQKMSNLFEVAPQTVEANIKYYKLHGSTSKPMRSVSKDITILAIDDFFGLRIAEGVQKIKIDPTAPEVQTALKHIMRAEQSIAALRQELLVVRRNIIDMLRFRGIYKVKHKLPQTKLNSTCLSILTELGYVVEVEYKLEDKYFDFKFKGYKLLLEIDSGHYHTTPAQLENDALKNTIAERNNFMLLRVFSDKDKRPALKKKIEACLQELELRKSLL